MATSVRIFYRGSEGPVAYEVTLDEQALAELIEKADRLQEETEDRMSE